jgi:hypothetical protein
MQRFLFGVVVLALGVVVALVLAHLVGAWLGHEVGYSMRTISPPGTPHHPHSTYSCPGWFRRRHLCGTW